MSAAQIGVSALRQARREMDVTTSERSLGVRLRVGAVSYLNTKPLVYRLGEIAPDIDLSFDLPSRLADQLSSGRLDVALIPSIEYLRNPGYVIVSDACIGCRGPVLSVKLLSRKPMSRISDLALDEGSRTSAVLARILLQEHFGILPELRILPIGSDPRQCPTDAVLLIGDRAIHAPWGEFVERWDLGDQWYQWSGLPFVFAAWVARAGACSESLQAALAAARDAGVADLPQIARQHARRAGLTESETLHYLRDNLHFFLGPDERRGLQLFSRRAADLGELSPNVREMR